MEKISIMNLFNKPNLDIDGITSNLTIEDLIFASCRGGWPASLNKKSERGQLSVVYSYLDVICNIDISNIDGVKRDPKRVKNILRSYARNISTNVKDTTIIET